VSSSPRAILIADGTTVVGRDIIAGNVRAIIIGGGRDLRVNA